MAVIGVVVVLTNVLPWLSYEPSLKLYIKLTLSLVFTVLKLSKSILVYPTPVESDIKLSTCQPLLPS